MIRPEYFAVVRNWQLKNVSQDHPAPRQNLWVDFQPRENLYSNMSNVNLKQKHLNMLTLPIPLSKTSNILSHIKHIITHQAHCLFKVVEGSCRF